MRMFWGGPKLSYFLEIVAKWNLAHTPIRYVGHAANVLA